MSVGAIVGIILGSVFLFFIALLAVVFCIRKKKRKDGGAIVFQGSRSAGTTFLSFFICAPKVTISFEVCILSHLIACLECGFLRGHEI